MTGSGRGDGGGVTGGAAEAEHNRLRAYDGLRPGHRRPCDLPLQLGDPLFDFVKAVMQNDPANQQDDEDACQEKGIHKRNLRLTSDYATTPDNCCARDFTPRRSSLPVPSRGSDSTK